MTRPPQKEMASNRHSDSVRGATAAEYPVVASLVAAVVVGSVTALGVAVQGPFVIPVGL